MFVDIYFYGIDSPYQFVWLFYSFIESKGNFECKKRVCKICRLDIVPFFDEQVFRLLVEYELLIFDNYFISSVFLNQIFIKIRLSLHGLLLRNVLVSIRFSSSYNWYLKMMYGKKIYVIIYDKECAWIWSLLLIQCCLMWIIHSKVKTEFVSLLQNKKFKIELN